MEQWKEIVGYPDYQVSNLGNVRSTWVKGKVKPIKIQVDGNGYYWVGIVGSLGRKKLKTSRLVALAFIPNPENLPTVDHIDRDKSNNKVENLRWASYKEQHDNRREFVYVKGEDNPSSVWTTEEVLYIKKLNRQGLGKRKIAKILGADPNRVQSAIVSWQHLNPDSES